MNREASIGVSIASSNSSRKYNLQRMAASSSIEMMVNYIEWKWSGHSEQHYHS